MPHPLAAYGWDDRVAALFDLMEHDVCGRVIRVDRGSCLVATPAGVVRAWPYRAASRAAGLEHVPVTGDWVAITDAAAGEHGDAEWAVAAILPRWSALSRKEAEDRVAAEQVLVANIDVVALVIGLDAPIIANRVERMLAAAWESGAVPIMVLTKADIASDSADRRRDLTAISGGADVHQTSAITAQGIDALHSLIRPARTLALIGASGAGKSSLVNALAGSNVQSTGAVREDDHRGRHTTTSRDLIVLPTGGVVVDTPGLRGLALWDASAGVAAAFSDVDELAVGCRFSNCAHLSEPGCAVRAAAASGALPRRRLASYHKLQDELASLDVRREEQSRRAAAASGRRPKKQ